MNLEKSLDDIINEQQEKKRSGGRGGGRGQTDRRRGGSYSRRGGIQKDRTGDLRDQLNVGRDNKRFYNDRRPYRSRDGRLNKRDDWGTGGRGRGGGEDRDTRTAGRGQGSSAISVDQLQQIQTMQQMQQMQLMAMMAATMGGQGMRGRGRGRNRGRGGRGRGRGRGWSNSESQDIMYQGMEDYETIEEDDSSLVYKIDGETVVAASKLDGRLVLSSKGLIRDSRLLDSLKSILGLFSFDIKENHVDEGDSMRTDWMVTGKNFMKRFEDGMSIPPIGPQSKNRAAQIKLAKFGAEDENQEDEELDGDEQAGGEEISVEMED